MRRLLMERPLRVVTFACETFRDVEPQALGLTYWFDADEEGAAYPVTIRFVGHRVGVRRKPTPRDRFSVLETIEDVVPSSGRLAITTRVFDIAPGEWQVTATPVKDPDPRGAGSRSASTRPRLPHASVSGTTVLAPVVRVRAPGARLGVWPALVGLGVAVALSTQALLATHSHLPAARVLSISLAASMVGLVGAKLYYLALHRDEAGGLVTTGMCVQGLVLGGIATIIVGALATGLSVGRVLDVTAPGLLFGITIGRFGCFFGGCCAGRPTASRWGLWSSDRRLGVRRIPTQLLESAMALVVGVVALLAVLTTSPHPAGVVFIGAIAAYTLGRQFLFPLRDLPRHTLHGRAVTIVLVGFVLVADLAVAAFT